MSFWDQVKEAGKLAQITIDEKAKEAQRRLEEAKIGDKLKEFGDKANEFGEKLEQKMNELDEEHKISDKANEFGKNAQAEIERARIGQRIGYAADVAGAAIAESVDELAAMAEEEGIIDEAERDFVTVCVDGERLGLQLQRRERDSACLVAHVKEGGPGARAGVKGGDIVVSIGGVPTPTFVEVMEALPRAPRPVVLALARRRPSARPSAGRVAGALGVLGDDLPGEIAQATAAINRMANANAVEGDAGTGVPAHVLENCAGVVVLRVARFGLGISGRVGSGVIVARRPGRTAGSRCDSGAGEGWSAPAAVRLDAVGVGWAIGGDVTEVLLVLNTRGAVESLVASGGGMKLGGEMAVAAGPNGRGIGASLEPPRLASPDAGLGLAYDENGAMATPFEPPTDVEPIYSYSHAKGAFIGVSIEGSLIAPRNDVNERYYGRGATARMIVLDLDVDDLGATSVDDAPMFGGSVEPEDSPMFGGSVGPDETGESPHDPAADAVPPRARPPALAVAFPKEVELTVGV